MLARSPCSGVQVPDRTYADLQPDSCHSTIKMKPTLSLESDRLFVPSDNKFLELLVSRTGCLSSVCSVQWRVVCANGEETLKAGQIHFEK